MPSPSLIPHAIRTSSTAEIQAEIARIIASTDTAGPVFGAGYSNYRTALSDLRAELATRPKSAPPAPAPAPVLPDGERRDLARALASAGKSREQIASALGADRATVDAWLDGPDDDGGDDADATTAKDQIPNPTHDPHQRIEAAKELLRQQVAGGSGYKVS